MPLAVLSLRTNDSHTAEETHRSQARGLLLFGSRPKLRSQVEPVVGAFLPRSCQIWITSHERLLSVASHINSGSTHLSYASHLWERASVNLAVFVVPIKRWKFCSFHCISCFIRVIAAVYCADSLQHWRASPVEAPLWLIIVEGGGGWEGGWRGTEEGNDSDSADACVLPIIPVKKAQIQTH